MFWRILIALVLIVLVVRGVNLAINLDKANRVAPPRPVATQPDPAGSIQYGDFTLTPEMLATMEEGARSPELQALRHAVDECLGRRPANPDDRRCEDGMQNDSGPALEDRFCLLSAEPGDFGGKVYLVITRTPPHELLVLWGFVYDGAELPVLRGTWLAGMPPEQAAMIAKDFGAMCVAHPSVQF